MKRLGVLLLPLAALALAPGCRDVRNATAARAAPAGLFTDVAERAGVRFRLDSGARGRHYLIETTGSGCAFFDYDGDGRPDLLFVQAGPLPWERKAGTEPRNRLYRNRGDGTFADVTAGSGLEDTGYSQGVAVGDYDGDGYKDVFVAAYGGNHLFRNLNGSGRFQDVTARAGLADNARGPRWCTSAAFGDYDNDGRLDLYVCRYSDWSPETEKHCTNPRGSPSYCSPEVYPPAEHALYRNNGDGTFADVSRKAGITARQGHGLGVAWLDFNGDGWEDLFVANDLSPFLLWRNNGNGTFTDVAEHAGVAYSDMGQLLSGMGVAVRDFNGDGLEDLFVTNFYGQMNALYRNDGKQMFTNVTVPSGIGPASFNRLAFGCEFLDFDRDGLPDLLVGNGHVNEDVAAYSQGVDYAEPKSLLRNNGNGTFTDLRDGLGSLAVPRVTRGLAVCDFDGDGHLDAAASDQDGPAELLRYTGPSSGHWLMIDPRGTTGNRDGYHAKVTVRAGGRTYFSEVRSGSSYQSHSDSRLYFGLGPAATVDELR
ncbi:MAG TPA: CRTAC1 family protein, partial [Armatimonadota bacterium]|nr:CRTAC1 family protein [Armatimonadota bacterium]